MTDPRIMADIDAKAKELVCLGCSHQMGNIMGNRGHQPDDGLSFHSHGHYGSAVFDAMDGSYIQIAICDRCLQRGIDSGVVHISDPDPSSPYALESMPSLSEQLEELDSHALILSQAETIAELRRLNERYASGLRTIASTFYKADQHQDYAKHVLESARAAKEGQ